MKTKDVIFKVKGQNVYKEYTDHGRVFTDFICVATSVSHAEEIKQAFDAAKELIDKTTAQDTGLIEARCFAAFALAY